MKCTGLSLATFLLFGSACIGLHRLLGDIRDANEAVDNSVCGSGGLALYAGVIGGGFLTATTAVFFLSIPARRLHDLRPAYRAAGFFGLVSVAVVAGALRYESWAYWTGFGAGLAIIVVVATMWFFRRWKSH